MAQCMERQTCNLALWVRILGLVGIFGGGGVNNEHSFHLQYPDGGP